MISGSNSAIAYQSSRANHRIQQAFRDSTSKAYNSMFRVFLAFCVFAQVRTSQVTIDTMLALQTLGSPISFLLSKLSLSSFG